MIYSNSPEVSYFGKNFIRFPFRKSFNIPSVSLVKIFFKIDPVCVKMTKSSHPPFSKIGWNIKTDKYLTYPHFRVFWRNVNERNQNWYQYCWLWRISCGKPKNFQTKISWSFAFFEFHSFRYHFAKKSKVGLCKNTCES